MQSLSNGWDALIGVLGGAVAVAAAFWLLFQRLMDHYLSKSLEQQKQTWTTAADSQLENLRASLGQRNTVASARVEYLRQLWEATHQYGGAIASLARGTGDPKEVSSRMDAFNGAVSRSGVFIGAKRYDDILSRIGGPFVDKLVSARDDPAERERLFQSFQHDLWPTVLDEIEGLLTAPLP